MAFPSQLVSCFSFPGSNPCASDICLRPLRLKTEQQQAGHRVSTEHKRVYTVSETHAERDTGLVERDLSPEADSYDVPECLLSNDQASADNMPGFTNAFVTGIFSTQNRASNKIDSCYAVF
ncbi:hypothetical protein CEXT_708271 [Caerostris extrusa]|uniref:Uncharacterized protein n=1 Tax=Caerostris extrusa TaxID=172846 RepID=A0AAV4Q768_CAEEX|nr:hypothetical protein CEXT_708271 [Caerostris extrusa]